MNILDTIKRIWFEVLILTSLVLLIIFVPSDYIPVVGKEHLVDLFITKFLLVSAAITHAHISRKLIFPYINFATEKDWSNNAMVIGWYIIVIFGWTRGG